MKAPGNYLDQLWSNKILVSLWEGPKPPNSKISGFVTPGEPLFMDFNIPKRLQPIQEALWTHFWKRNMIFANLRFKAFGNIWKSYPNSFSSLDGAQPSVHSSSNSFGFSKYIILDCTCEQYVWKYLESYSYSFSYLNVHNH